MGWCERCGAFFVLSSGKAIGRTIGARGRGIGITEITDTICPSCLRPDEGYDEYGNVYPKEILDAMRQHVEDV